LKRGEAGPMQKYPFRTRKEKEKKWSVGKRKVAKGGKKKKTDAHRADGGKAKKDTNKTLKGAEMRAKGVTTLKREGEGKGKYKEGKRKGKKKKNCGREKVCEWKGR